MIIKTKRYKLDKPIAFTEIFEVTVSMVHDSFIVSNGQDSTVARPVKGDKSETRSTDETMEEIKNAE